MACRSDDLCIDTFDPVIRIDPLAAGLLIPASRIAEAGTAGFAAVPHFTHERERMADPTVFRLVDDALPWDKP